MFQLLDDATKSLKQTGTGLSRRGNREGIDTVQYPCHLATITALTQCRS